MTQQTPIVIGIASNTEDRSYQMEKATEALCRLFQQVNVSSVYETEAVNGDGTKYCNAVMSGLTRMGEEDTVAKLKELEKEAGRTQTGAFEGKVPLDLDLVIWNGRIIRERDFEQRYFNIGYRELLASGAFQYSV